MQRPLLKITSLIICHLQPFSRQPFRRVSSPTPFNLVLIKGNEAQNPCRGSTLQTLSRHQNDSVMLMPHRFLSHRLTIIIVSSIMLKIARRPSVTGRKKWFVSKRRSPPRHRASETPCSSTHRRTHFGDHTYFVPSQRVVIR